MGLFKKIEFDYFYIQNTYLKRFYFKLLAFEIYTN